jgi:enhancing lycopene biosynthesis protein 2
MTKKIGVLLSGCGVFDGSEIHEAVLTLLALDRAGAETLCMAPDIEQYHVINHLTQEVSGEKRNVLVESARIARGRIADLAEIKSADLDGLIMPGGFGAAKNLSDFAFKGKDAVVHPGVRTLIREMTEAGKPVGAICISPAVLAAALSDRGPEVTIGSDEGTALAIEGLGGRHRVCTVNMIHHDMENRVVSTPAYMLGSRIGEVAGGIEKLVGKIMELA